jgi:transposase
MKDILAGRFHKAVSTRLANVKGFSDSPRHDAGQLYGYSYFEHGKRLCRFLIGCPNPGQCSVRFSGQRGGKQILKGPATEVEPKLCELVEQEFGVNKGNHSIPASGPTLTTPAQAAPAVILPNIARRLPEEIWAIFEPLLPPIVRSGEGPPPASNHICLHGLLYVLITGIGWEQVPNCFPSGRAIRERLRAWLAHDRFLTAWQHLAQRYEQLRGITWDKVLLDGPK